MRLAAWACALLPMNNEAVLLASTTSCFSGGVSPAPGNDGEAKPSKSHQQLENSRRRVWFDFLGAHLPEGVGEHRESRLGCSSQKADCSCGRHQLLPALPTSVPVASGPSFLLRLPADAAAASPLMQEIQLTPPASKNLEGRLSWAPTLSDGQEEGRVLR